MTPAFWLAGVATVSLAVSILTFIYTWNTNRARASQQELRSLGEKLRSLGDNLADEGKRRAASIGELRDRLVIVETQVKHLPSSDIAHELAMNIERMHGDMKELREALKGVQGQLETVNNHLLNEGRR